MTDTATRQLYAALREGFEGPKDTVSYYLDGGPDAGLRRTLASLSAEEASRDWGGNSVAAHAHHILFSFDAFGAYIAGDPTPRDWNESWAVNTVDAAQWEALQQKLADRYTALKHAFKTLPDNEKAVGGAVAAVAHLAYHIGAIRQKIAASRNAVAAA